MSWIRKRDAWETATAVLLAVYALLIFLTFRDYGVTVDEEHSSANGRYFLDWYSSGFHDRAIITDNNQRLYGSFFNAVSAFASNHSPFGMYETGHLLIALAGLAGIFVVSRIGKRVGGSMAGFFSALVLFLTPLYYGHSFMNPKDVPFAVLFLTSVYCLLAAYDHLPKLGSQWVAALGVSIGLTLGIRVGGVMLFGYGVVLICFWLLAKYRKDPSYRGPAIWKFLRAVAVPCIAVGVVSWLVMLVWWPYGQLEPILNPLRAIRSNANFTDFQATSLYRGHFVSSTALPWHYLPTWFAVTLPEFYALILSIGLITLLISRLKRKPGTRHIDADSQSRMLFLIFATFFPIATAVLMQPILYDGNRHFLFVVPLLAALTGVTLAWLLSNGLQRPLRIALAALLVVIGAATAADMVRLHPYQYVFFNRSSGGLRAALGRYETDYWGESHKEGMDWLIANYKPDAPAGSIRVATTAADFQTAYYLGGDRPETRRFVPVRRRDRPDVMLSVTRWDVHLGYPGRVVHVVERMGTPLLYVVELSPAKG